MGEAPPVMGLHRDHGAFECGDGVLAVYDPENPDSNVINRY